MPDESISCIVSKKEVTLSIICRFLAYFVVVHKARGRVSLQRLS